MMRAVGEMPEWPNGTDSKSVVLATVPRVRIPISPPLLNKTKPLKWSNISGAFSLCPGIAGKPAPTVGASVLAMPEPSPWPLSVGASLLAMAALQPRGPCGQSDKARPELAPPVPVGASLLAMATLRSAKQPRDPCGQSDKARPEPAPLSVGASSLAMATLLSAMQPRGGCSQAGKVLNEPRSL